MAVGSLLTAKNQGITYQPLMLVEAILVDGTRLNWSTHDLRLSTLGYQYGGVDWQPRIESPELSAQQALSDQGIDYAPSLSLKLADADGYLWGLERTKGFKGAVLRAIFVLWNVDQNDFSTEYMSKFLGIAKAPKLDGNSMTLVADNKMSLSAQLPSLRIQKTCPWTFPSALVQRQDGADNDDSPYYECGYSPDASGANAVGTYSTGITPFTSCDYTKESCQGRGMYTVDASARITGSFGGITWSPPESIQSRGYTNGGKWEEIIQGKNEGNYGKPIPLVYGTQWVDPAIISLTGDANLTKMEALLCYGEIDYVHEVIVNGVRIPHVDNESRFPSMSSIKEGGNTIKGFWQMSNRGIRRAQPTDDALFTDSSGVPLGDPHGSLAVIEIVVPRKLADASSTPKVNVRVKAGRVRVFAAESSLFVSGATNASPIVITTTVPHSWTNGSIVNLDSVGGNLSANGQWVALNVGTSTAELWDYSNAERMVPSRGSGAYTSSGTAQRLSWTKSYSENPLWILLDILTWCGWRVTDVHLRTLIDSAAHCDAVIPYTNMFGSSTTHARYSSSVTLTTKRSAAEIIRGLRNNCKGMLLPNYEKYGKLSISIKSTLAQQQPYPVPGSNYDTAVSSLLPDGSSANGYLAYSFSDRDIVRTAKGDPSLAIDPRFDNAPNKYTAQFQNAEGDRYPTESFIMLDAEDVSRIGSEIAGDLQQVGIQNFDQARRTFASALAEGYRGNFRLSADGQSIGDTGGTALFKFTTSIQGAHLKAGDLCWLTSQTRSITNQIFRVISVLPAPNFEKIQIVGMFHNDLWYLDTFGQVGAPKYRPSVRNKYDRPSYPWSPAYATPLAGDAMFGVTDQSFGLSQTYETAADGSSIAKLSLSGRLPVNLLPASPEPPYIAPQGNTASTGGTIRGGQTVFVKICGKTVVGASYKPTAGQVYPCAIAVASGTNTNTVTVPTIQWDGLCAGMVVFAGSSAEKLTYQFDTDTTPASVTLTSLNENSWGMPDPEFDHLRIRVKRSIHSGIWGAEVVSVTSTTITVSTATSFTTNEFANRVLSLVAMNGSNGEIPIANFPVASNTGDTLTFSGGAINPATVARPGGGTGIAVGDVVILRMAPTYGSDSTGVYLEDLLLENVFNAGAGLTADAEKGNTLRCISGTGRGMQVKVRSNTTTRVYIDGTWPITPDSTSIWVIEEPTWQFDYHTESTNNDNPSNTSVTPVDVNNYKNQTLLVQVLTVDGGDNSPSEHNAPIREIYLYGELATLSLGDFNIQIAY
jgi:hypothetical protein